MASAFIGVSILMDTEALAGFAQGLRRSTGFGAQHYLNTIERRCPCGHREARKGFGVQLGWLDFKLFSNFNLAQGAKVGYACR